MENVFVSFNLCEFGSNVLYSNYEFDISSSIKEKVGKSYIFIENYDDVGMVKYLLKKYDGGSKRLDKVLYKYIIDNDNKNKFDSKIFKSLVMRIEKGSSELEEY